MFVGLVLLAWFLGGGPGRALRGSGGAGTFPLSELADGLGQQARAIWSWDLFGGIAPAKLSVALTLTLSAVIAFVRWRARGQRRYVRLQIDAYRTDRASAQAVVAMFETLHKRLLRRWWRRLRLVCSMQGSP